MKNNIGLFFTGVGIGIFLGLSESPILLQILVPLLTIMVGLLSILTGQKSDEKPNEHEGNFLAKKNITPFPIMWIVLGMVAGSFLGLFAKNYDITGQGVLFGKRLSTEPVAKDNVNKFNNEQRATSTFLHNVTQTDCEKFNLCNLSGLEIICALNSSESPAFEEFISAKEFNTDSIKLKITKLCNCQK